MPKGAVLGRHKVCTRNSISSCLLLMSLIDPTLRRFLSYARPYRWWIVLAAVSGLLKFNLPLVFPLALKHVVDALVSPPFDSAAIERWMWITVIVYLAWIIFSYLRSYVADRISQKMIFDLRHEFFLHLQQLSLDFYERRAVGSVASRLLGDIQIAQNFVGAAFVSTVMDLSTVIFIAVILLLQDAQLALVALLVLPVYTLLYRYFQRRIKHTSQLAQSKMEEIAGSVTEQLAATPIVQAYTREKTQEKRFFRHTRDHLSYLLKNVRNNAMAVTSVGFITGIAPVFVVWYGAHRVMDGELTTGGLVAFYAYLGMFYGPLNRLTEMGILMANSRSAMERIFEVFDTAPAVTDRDDAVSLDRVRGELRFDHVNFAYANETEPVLSDVSLHVPAGQTVALVGRSGAGKTTFAKLISRFYDASRGAIFLDGKDIRGVRLKSLRTQIALVTQDPILFSGTVVENIAYGKQHATLEEIIAAAKTADAHDFIMRLPLGYETVIGERGVNLSGGQKQRLTLARAFLRDAPILILDEATSSLDSESEAAIQKALKRLMAGRTTFVIAHRLSTVKAADRIVVFDHGRVVELGRHEELLALPNGIYRKLYDEQFQ